MRTTTRFLITLVALITTTASAWAQVKKVPGDSNPGTGIGGVTIIDTPAADPNAFTKGDDGKWTLAEFPAYTAKLNIQYEALPTITLPATLTGGTLACTVGGNEQTYAEAGQTVTLTATPKDGYMLKSLTVKSGSGIAAFVENEVYTFDQIKEYAIANSLSCEIYGSRDKIYIDADGTVRFDVITEEQAAADNYVFAGIMNGTSTFGRTDDPLTYPDGGPGTAVTLTPDATDQTKYTFTMPDADVTVEAEFEESPYITIEAEENDETVKTEVIVNKDEDAGTVEITAAQPVGSSTVVAFPATINVKGKDYTLKGIAADALKDQTAVTDIYLPETDKPLTIAEGALKIDDSHVATIHSPLALLDDYALMSSLKQNYEAVKVMATVEPATQYWTLSSGVDVIVPEGVKAYTCQLSDDGTKVLITELTDAELTVGDKKIIMANNGVLISATSGNAYDIVANPGRQKSGTPPATSDAKNYDDNLLEPVIESKHYAAGDYYVLYNAEFRAIQDNTSTVPACKAVLKKPAGVAASRSLGIGHADGTTGISGVQMTDDGAQIYTLQGQRVSASQLRKGTIYIQNGKKLTK